MLHGRDAESARLAELVAGATASRGGALVVRGEPGVGKTALLVGAAARARGQVLWTQGIESEAPLAFAALHRLLRPVLPYLDRIPESQAAALRLALGEREGRTGDRFVIFAATMSLLAEAAEVQPLLCVVDDAHWLDSASAEALLFVARRLHIDRVALLFGAREGDVRRFEAVGLPELVVTGLDAPAAAALLAEHAGLAVSDAVRDELVARTGGNPLALVELTGVLSGDQLAGASRLPAQLPLTQGVERAFLDRARRMTPDGQTLLLVAAADDSGRVTIVRRAAALLGATSSSLDAAERSGLVRVRGAELVLQHPLVRSAVYAAATTSQRHAVHRVLADVLDGAGEVDRRTWHLSLTTEDPDDDIAAELDITAERAECRGGHEAASAAWERAAELTGPAGPRAQRLYAAATSAWLAGDTGRSRALAEDARQHTTEPVLRADVDRLRGRLEWNVGSPEAGHRLLMRAARDVATADPVRALEMAMIATVLATFGAKPDASIDPAEFLPPIPDTAPPRLRCLFALLTGHQDVLRGHMRTAATSLRRGFAIGDALDDDVDLLSNLGLGALHLGDDEVTDRNYTRLLDLARDRGALSLMVYALARLPFAQFPAGRWGAASAAAGEALDLARAAGQAPLTALPLAWQALLAAQRGEPGVRDALAELEALCARHPIGIATAAVDDLVEWAKGTAASAAHDPAGALHHLGRITLPPIQRMAALDRIEAAVHAGSGELASAWIEDLASFAEAVDAMWAAAAAQHGRALLAGPDDSESHFRLALALHRQTGRHVAQARTQLAYGEFLRRNRHRVDARTQLRAALHVFDDIGASPWAERASQELRASGETARKRDVSTGEHLTLQERQTALLVSQGLSNQAAAARLFLSPRTIEYHLSNAYRKLGVRSRGELAQLTLV